ncbi:MAG TPA: helix-turn-helix domain-containing protein [Ilumatobacteraceae bacterium]|nr:helix-turn-helix domain-containing protein [Ilumatobacteraceae bacterium]HRB04677.1 helix-turn-helix domain-containing protein [Ilumatobacteraceae bacterium]
MEMADRLRAARTNTGLSQSDVAVRAGTTQSAIARYETGAVTPHHETFARIMAAIGYTPSQALRQHHERVVEVVTQYDVSELQVFGSTARHDDTCLSDLDLVATFGPHVSFVDITSFQEDLESVLGVPVDVISAAGLRPERLTAHREIIAEMVPV